MKSRRRVNSAVTQMPKRPESITQNKLIAAAEHLAQSREQFISQMRLMAEASNALNDRLRSFSDYLDGRDKAIHARIELNNSVHDSLQSLVKVLTDNTIALNENTDKLDRFLTKFETYFGTDRGLELEN